MTLWTKANETQLRQCISDKMTQAETAKLMGLHSSAICQKARRMGLEWLACGWKRGPEWTPERIELVRQLYIVQGLSARQIAEKMGDVTRNSIIGVVHRQGWSLPPKDAQARQGAAYRPAHRIAAEAHRTLPRKIPAKPMKSPPSTPPGPTVSIFELTEVSCRWIDGDPTADQPYCGALRIHGSPYCKRHHAVSVQPKERRRA